MTQFFLWAIPDGEAFEQFDELIRGLGEQYQGPPFEPHVTLVGRIDGEEADLVGRVRRFAEKMPPLSIELLPPSHDQEYFRCVYFPVKNTPALLTANQQAHRLLGKMPFPPFRPHLSMLYGELSLRDRLEIVEALPANLPQEFLASTLTLIRAETLNPKQWAVMDRVGLSGERD